MGPLAVDPEALFAAGSAVVAAGEGLNAAMTVLTAGFGANTGSDIAGEVFGLAYQSAAGSLLKSATAAVNACLQNGVAIQIDASNWSKAEAASTLGGGAGVLQAPAVPAKIGPPGPPGTLGAGEPPPPLWALVQPLVDSLWPDGDVAGLHAAAGCWRTFGAAVAGMGDALSGPETLIGTQEMPERFLMIQVLSQMKDAIGRLSVQCGKIADKVDDFAKDVANAQNNIRDLMRRLGSLTDVWHDMVSLLDGDLLDEIKQIVKDINAVLHHLGREARAFEQGIKVIMQAADGLIVDMEKMARRQLTHFLGDEVGNPVATVFDTVINTNEGIVKVGVQAGLGMADLGPGWLLLDPKGAEATWKGAVEGQFKSGLLYEMLNPREGGPAYLQMWKSLLHLDDWSTARPGLGLGENAADALTFLIPGVGEAGAGSEVGSAAARVAEDAAGEAGAAGVAGESASAAGTLGGIGKAGTNLTKDLGNLNLDVPKADIPTAGRPVGAPPVEAPATPLRPVESAPPGTPSPHSPTEPSGPASGRPGAPVGPHETEPVPASGPREPMPVPAAPAEQLPSHTPHLAEPAPARVPASTDGLPAESAPAAGQSPQQAPALASATPQASTPHFAPPSASPAELPAPGGSGWHGPEDGGSAGTGPHVPTTPGDGSSAPGHGGPPNEGPPKPLSDGDGRSESGHDGVQSVERQDPVHSHEPSGDGWHRLPDKPTDPHYGEPLPEHWDFEGDSADPSQIKASVSKLIRDPDAPFGRDDLGRAYTQDEYAERFNKLSPDGDHWMNFPGNDGAASGTKVAFTDANQFAKFYGRLLDRIGNDGKYLAIMEDGIPASWEERALHVNSLSDPYHAYTFESLPDGWQVEVSEVAPGLGQPGGSTQVRILDSTGRAMTVDELIELGVLE